MARAGSSSGHIGQPRPTGQLGLGGAAALLVPVRAEAPRSGARGGQRDQILTAPPAPVDSRPVSNVTNTNSNSSVKKVGDVIFNITINGKGGDEQATRTSMRRMVRDEIVPELRNLGVIRG